MTYSSDWTLRKTALAGLLCALACLSGCGSARVVYVPDGEPVRLRESIKAKIWAADKNGAEVPSEMLLPEGWYCLPDPGK